MKEENAIVLEYLPNGYPLEGRRLPVVQAVGKNSLVLLELVPRKGIELGIGEEVYIGEGKRDKIYYILGRLKREKLTEGAKNQLQEVIQSFIKENEPKFIEFFNVADAINKRMHQLELLPGLGKKHMQELLKQRKEKMFENFEDIRKRVANFPDPEKIIEKRIIKELTSMERYNLFTKA